MLPRASSSVDSSLNLSARISRTMNLDLNRRASYLAVSLPIPRHAPVIRITELESRERGGFRVYILWIMYTMTRKVIQKSI